VQHSDEVTLMELSFDKVLRLHAISHAIVRTIQNIRANCLLHVLFDSGTAEAFCFTARSEPIFGTKTKCHQCDL
jgi:hypothetical protein